MGRRVECKAEDPLIFACRQKRDDSLNVLMKAEDPLTFCLHKTRDDGLKRLPPVTLVYKDSPFFDCQTAQAEFERNLADLDDVNGFAGIVSQGDFWNVYKNGAYVGSVFVIMAEDNRLWLGGYAQRKRHKECAEALRLVCPLYDRLYADTRHLNAVILLKEVGFKWLSRKKRMLIWRKQ